MAISQDNRLLALTTPLGKDAVIPYAFSGREAMSELFEFTIDMVSEEATLDPARLLGQRVTLSVRHTGTSERHFNGIVRKLEQGMPYSLGLRRYRAFVVPELWLTTLRRNFRFFQEKDVQTIVKKVLGDAGIMPKFRAGGGKTVRDYCVQYDETDFNFVSRLLEEEGLFYFFNHSANGHEMIIGDSAAHYEDCAERELELHVSGSFHGSALSSWEVSDALFSGTVSQSDYNLEAPTVSLESTETTTFKLAALKKHESHHYPGRYLDKTVGKKLTINRLEAEEAASQIRQGTGTTAGLFPGGRTRLARAIYDGPGNPGFVCTEVEHSAQDETHLAQSSGNSSYSNSFRGAPDNLVVRPRRRAQRELVRGPLTAVVVGPSGEEIWTDEYGRVKVQFHWDRLGKKDENSSCWVRVAQMLAGKNWGSQFIPRIGMEVVVQFLNGDPDRPLVVGAVYNAENPPPYAPRSNKTQSGLKTRSTPKGDSATFNELRFEDKKGSEHVYMHAEKDFERVVENDDKLNVGNDQTIEVKKNRTKTITEGNETIKIDTGNRAATIAKGDDSLTLSAGGRIVDLKGSGNHALKLASGNASIALQSGNYSLKASAGKVTIEAAQSIELKVGTSSVKLTPAGIEMKGTMIKASATASAEVKGAMIDVKASGVLTLNGSLTKIN